MQISYSDYCRRLKGCFLGKAVGGTLGMPFEGDIGVRQVDYYDPIPTEMVPNDDLDLQVVWLEAIRTYGLPTNRWHLSRAWQDHIGFPIDEYGAALLNLRTGVGAPMSGCLNNKFYNGMGAAIRSEIWAVLCPGNPALAASFAREDACVDHCKEGVDACVFLAAIESAAFTQSDRQTLIETGLSYIDPDGRLAGAFRDTIRWWEAYGDILAVREKILQKYPNPNWTDVTINLCFLLLAWLAGDDFGSCICTAVNLGYDTDCTAASLGSILGILNPEIDPKWLEPIGEKLVLSSYIVGMHAAPTLGGMCGQLAALCLEVQEYYRTGIVLTDAPPFEEERSNMAPPWTDDPWAVALEPGYSTREALAAVSPFAVTVRYPEGLSLIPGQANILQIQVRNTSGGPDPSGLRLRVPDGWRLDRRAVPLAFSGKEPALCCVAVTPPDSGQTVYSLDSLQISIEGGGYAWEVQAALPVARSWRFVPADRVEAFEGLERRELAKGRILYSQGNLLKIGPQGGYYAIDFCMHLGHLTRLIAHSTRPVKLWIDGFMVLEHGAWFYTPSPHRRECAVSCDLAAGWHKAVIHVQADPEGRDGELYFAPTDPLGPCFFHQTAWKLVT